MRGICKKREVWFTRTSAVERLKCQRTICSAFFFVFSWVVVRAVMETI